MHGVEKERVFKMTSLSYSYRAIADNQLNYLSPYPYIGWPANTFSGTRIQATPYYISNQIRNVTIREVHSPLTFDSKAGVNYVPSAVVPVWPAFNPLASKNITQTAAKVFVGQYFDSAADISGFEYQYDFSGQQVFVRDDVVIGQTGLIVLSLNLANRTNTTNLPVYVDTAICDPCNQLYQSSHLNRCQVGSSENFFNTLSGFIRVAGQTISLDNALPYKNAAVNCPDAPASSPLYYIAGNRLLISVPISASSTPARHVSYAVTARIVETTQPIQSALLPLLNLPPYPVLPPLI